MKRLLLALALVCSPAFAVDTPPSDASLHELLNITDAPKLIDSMTGQIDGMMKGMIAQAANGQEVTPAQQAAIDKFQAGVVDIMRAELTWEKLEPMYLRIYRESLSQEEVDGMLAFYKTPAGQATIKKIPVIMQKSMAEMPAKMNSMMQKMQALTQEFAAEMQAAETAPTAEATPEPAPAQ